jgi:hypothetical protein
MNRKNLENQQGRLVLEATFIVPVLMATFISLLLFTIHIFELNKAIFRANYIAFHYADNYMFDLKNNKKLKQLNVKRIRTSFFSAYSAQVKNYYGVQTVSDPVQTLRNIDFVTVYYPKVMRTFQTNRKLINRMDWLKGLAYKEYFNKHAEAARYLRKLVKGHTRKFKTPFGYRIIDAYDKYGVVNQAYLTFNEKQLLIQLKKDSWLLHNNKFVRGVVWHFFKKSERIPKEPNVIFVRYASNHGIIIVGHVGE